MLEIPMKSILSRESFPKYWHHPCRKWHGGIANRPTVGQPSPADDSVRESRLERKSQFSVPGNGDVKLGYHNFAILHLLSLQIRRRVLIGEQLGPPCLSKCNSLFFRLIADP